MPTTSIGCGGSNNPQRPQQRSGQRRRRPQDGSASRGFPGQGPIPVSQLGLRFRLQFGAEPRAPVPSDCSTVRPAMPAAPDGPAAHRRTIRLAAARAARSPTRGRGFPRPRRATRRRASCSWASASKCSGAAVGRNRLMSMLNGRRFWQTSWHVRRKTPCPCSSKRRDSWLSNSPNTCSIASWCVVGCSKHHAPTTARGHGAPRWARRSCRQACPGVRSRARQNGPPSWPAAGGSIARSGESPADAVVRSGAAAAATLRPAGNPKTPCLPAEARRYAAGIRASFSARPFQAVSSARKGRPDRCLCLLRQHFAPAGKSPGGADRIGNRHAHRQTLLPAGRDDHPRQRLLAAEQMGQPADVHQQRVRLVGLIEPDDGTELLAPSGQLRRALPDRGERRGRQKGDAPLFRGSANSVCASASGMPGRTACSQAAAEQAFTRWP